MKVLVTSPNPHHLRLVSEALASRSQGVTAVEGGVAKACALAKEQQPDLLVLDGMCRDLDELQHLERLSAQFPALAIVLLCPAPTQEFLLHAMQAGVREVLASPPPAPALAAMADRVIARMAPRPPSRKGRVLALVGSKGGVGTSFLAANLARHLSDAHSVLLVDLNLQFGDAFALLHDGRPATTIADLARDIGRLDASLLAATTIEITPGLGLLAAPEDPAEGASIRPEHVEAIVEVARSCHDFVVLDMGRTFDPKALRAFDLADTIFTVVTLDVPSLRNAARLMDALASLGYGADKREVIVNRFERSTHLGLDELRKSLRGIQVHTIPNGWKDASDSVNEGIALVQKDPSSPVARAICAVGQAIAPVAREKTSILHRLLKRA